MFCTSTEENLKNKRLGEDDRKYIVSVLATILCSFIPNPSMKDCAVVAESLLRKFSFLKESVSLLLDSIKIVISIHVFLLFSS